MEKVIKHIPILLLFASVCRSVVFGAQISDSIIVVALAGLCFLLSNIKYNDINKKLQEDMDNLSKKRVEDLSKLVEQINKINQDFAETKTYVSSVKMASSFGRK